MNVGKISEKRNGVIKENNTIFINSCTNLCTSTTSPYILTNDIKTLIQRHISEHNHTIDSLNTLLKSLSNQANSYLHQNPSPSNSLIHSNLIQSIALLYTQSTYLNQQNRKRKLDPDTLNTYADTLFLYAFAALNHSFHYSINAQLSSLKITPNFPTNEIHIPVGINQFSISNSTPICTSYIHDSFVIIISPEPSLSPQTQNHSILIHANHLIPEQDIINTIHQLNLPQQSHLNCSIYGGLPNHEPSQLYYNTILNAISQTHFFITLTTPNVMNPSQPKAITFYPSTQTTTTSAFLRFNPDTYPFLTQHLFANSNPSLHKSSITTTAPIIPAPIYLTNSSLISAQILLHYVTKPNNSETENPYTQSLQLQNDQEIEKFYTQSLQLQKLPLVAQRAILFSIKNILSQTFKSHSTTLTHIQTYLKQNNISLHDPSNPNLLPHILTHLDLSPKYLGGTALNDSCLDAYTAYKIIQSLFPESSACSKYLEKNPHVKYLLSPKELSSTLTTIPSSHP